MMKYSNYNGYEQVPGKDLVALNLKICKRCIYDQTTPGIEFDDEGICNYCHMIEKLIHDYKTATPEGEEKFAQIVEEIKRKGKGKKYDCIIGVSGGTDSSYLVHLAVKMGLRPLAVHFDNTWNTSIATENIRKVLGKLKVDLYTHVVDNKEMDDIYRSFLKANVMEVDAPTDLAISELTYRAAAKYGIKYVLEGHSFMAEGISPLGSAYNDGKYISGIHELYGKIHIKTYPLMTFWRFLKWILFFRIKKIRPLWYIPYSKEVAKQILETEYGWSYYGGHHLENRLNAFCHSYYYPLKFNIDQRNNSLSASARSGYLTREEALEEYRKSPHIEPDLVEYLKKRLMLSDEDFNTIMNASPKTFREYKTYKKRFELLRPLFYILAKAQLVPMSFYLKYCFPVKSQ
jgi:N-acetyl sugar amidotransferase